MILHTMTLSLSSPRPIHEPAEELRGFFASGFSEYAKLHRHDADRFIHRYPVVQYKTIASVPTVIGINEGAEFLKQVSDAGREIRIGEISYRFVASGSSVNEEEFGISDT